MDNISQESRIFIVSVLWLGLQETSQIVRRWRKQREGEKCEGECPQRSFIVCTIIANYEGFLYLGLLNIILSKLHSCS